jgi:hypothetical protein
MALVGGGDCPAWAPNHLILWEDQHQSILQDFEFKTKEIKALHLTKDRIIIVLKTSVHIWTMAENPQRLHVFDTIDNEFGLQQHLMHSML